MNSLMSSLLARRVPHFVAIYAGVSWGLIEFIQLIVEEFLLSPHWTRVVLVAAPLLLPSAFLLAWVYGAPGRDRASLAQKMAVGVNLAVAAVVLALMFGGVDLEAAVTRVTVETEDGETVERMIPKTEFRKRVATFAFDAGAGLDDEDAWLSYLVPVALDLDLASDDFYEPVEFAQGALQEAGFQDLRNVPFALKRQAAKDRHTEFIVSGVIDRADGAYLAAMAVHRVDSGALVEEARYEGPDLLGLVDAMSVDLKKALQIPSRDEVDDLPLHDRLTRNSAAIEAYGRARQALVVNSDHGAAIEHLRAATAADPTFAFAQTELGLSLLGDNQAAEAASAMRAALDHIYKLPERYQFPAKLGYYLVANQPSKAWAIAEMWAELYPNDPWALEMLAEIQALQDNREASLKTLQRQFELDPGNAHLLKRIATLQEQLGDGEPAVATLRRYVALFPNDQAGHTALAALLQRQSRHDAAREVLDRALLLQPDRSGVTLALAALDLHVGRFAAADAGYERAQALAETPQEKAAALDGLRQRHLFGGEMDSAIAAMNAWSAEASLFMSRLDLAQARLGRGDIATYFDAGRDAEGVALFEALQGELTAIHAQFHVPVWQTYIALQRDDLAAAREAHDWALRGMEALQLYAARRMLAADAARIDELAGDHASALANYRRALDTDGVSTPHRSIGRVLRKLGRLDEAEAALREALRLVPADPRSHLELARILERKLDAAGAVEHLRLALAAWASADAGFQPARDAREKLAELHPIEGGAPSLQPSFEAVPPGARAPRPRTVHRSPIEGANQRFVMPSPRGDLPERGHLALE